MSRGPDRGMAWIDGHLRDVRNVTGGPISIGDRAVVTGADGGYILVSVDNGTWATPHRSDPTSSVLT